MPLTSTLRSTTATTVTPAILTRAWTPLAGISRAERQRAAAATAAVRTGREKTDEEPFHYATNHSRRTNRHGCIVGRGCWSFTPRTVQRTCGPCAVYGQRCSRADLRPGFAERVA